MTYHKTLSGVEIAIILNKRSIKIPDAQICRDHKISVNRLKRLADNYIVQENWNSNWPVPVFGPSNAPTYYPVPPEWNKNIVPGIPQGLYGKQ